MAAISAQVHIGYNYQVNRSSLHRVEVSEKNSSASSSTLISKGLNQNSTIATKQMLVKIISMLIFTNNVRALKLKVKQRLSL
jgi:acid stress-induced BolA-like protein IbaG/YrbA